ncbi:MAG: PH domain-containing protein [Bdellovibrionota bacterium]
MRVAENGVIRVRRSIRSVTVRLLFAAFVALSGILLSEQTAAFAAPIQVFGIDLRLPVFLLFFLVLIARPLTLILDGYCEISEHHVRSTVGLFSAHRSDVSIPYEELRGVRASQTLLDRFLGTGTVTAWTQNGSAPEIVVRGVAAPREIANLISERIDRAILSRKGQSQQ